VYWISCENILHVVEMFDDKTILKLIASCICATLADPFEEILIIEIGSACYLKKKS